MKITADHIITIQREIAGDSFISDDFARKFADRLNALSSSDAEIKKTPEEWQKELGITIFDPDGWDRKGGFDADWAKPLTKSEFQEKASRSTVIPSKRKAEPASDVPAGWRELREEEKKGQWVEGAKYWACNRWMQVERRAMGAWAAKTSRIIVPIEPAMVPWDCPEDVPGPVCYLTNHACRNGECSIVTQYDELGLYTSSRPDDVITWSELAGHWQHSTDRKQWFPCAKEAK